MNINHDFSQYNGKISEITSSDTSDIKNAASVNKMAEYALNYLNNNPVEDRAWECKFMIYPSHIPYHCPDIPPNKYGYDVISLADTDLRMDIVYKHMRYLAGITQASESEKGVRARAENYVGDDGACYSNPSACTGVYNEGYWLSIWGTAHNIIYYCDEFERTGNNEWLEKAKKAIDCVLPLADERDGMKDFPAGLAPYRDGVWLKDGWMQEHWRNYTFIVEPLAKYYSLSGDEYYLRQAILFTEGIIRCLRDDRDNIEINPQTGSFESHVHLHTRTLWGVSHLAYITRDMRYIKWAENVFKFVVAHGTDYGWYPEFLPLSGELTSETCINGDMMASAYYLAKCGCDGMYDVMERNWRNYLYHTQFRVTSDFIQLFKEIHKDKSENEVRAALEELKKIEGGFIAQVGLSDLVQRPSQFFNGRADYTIYMMGCCPPSAMLALYYISKAAVEEINDSIFINFSITLDTDLANLVSDYGKHDKLTITAKKAGTYYIKTPDWSDPSLVEITVNDKKTDRYWDGLHCHYVKINDIKSGDIIAISYQLAIFKQKFTPKTTYEAPEYTVNWIGNAVKSVEPAFQHLDLFGNQRGV